MPTLQNIQGSSLVSQFGDPIASGIERLQGRRRESAATTELEDLLRGALGQAPLEREQQPSGEGLLAQLRQGGGLFGRIGQGGGTALPEQRPQQEGGILGRLSPQLAQAINSARGNPEQEGQLREQVDSGAALSAELQALPNHAARVRRLAQEGGNLSARGEDIGRVTALSNLPPDQLDLELMKMQVIGKEAQQQLPALGEQGAIAAIMARNPQLGAGLLSRRDKQIEAERARRAAAQRAAAAARAPQGEFAKGLAQINRNEQQGHITSDQAAARRTALESRLLTDPGIAAGVKADQAAANLTKTEAEVKLLDQELGAGPALSEREERIERTIVDQGVDRTTAQAIVDGVLRVATDPQTGNTRVINLATETSYAPQPIGEELPPAIPPGVTEALEGGSSGGDASAAFGVTGFGANVVNTLTDAIGAGQMFPATDEATQVLDNLSTRTMLALSGEFPGRPSNLTREKIEEMIPKPGSVFMGKARATVKLREVSDLLAEAIAGADRIEKGTGSFSPADRASAAKSINQLVPIWEDYQSILKQLEGTSGSVTDVTNQKQFDALPSGAMFRLSNGATGTKE